LVASRVGRGKSKQWLYLFTTLTISADEVVALYGKRWNVESDLRGLKQTARLRRIAVHSVEMMEKELLAAVLAYNLVRAVMVMAARKAGLHTRQLSFTYATTWCGWELSTCCGPPLRTNKFNKWSASSNWSAAVNSPTGTSVAPSREPSGAAALPTLAKRKLSDIGLKRRPNSSSHPLCGGV